MSTPYYVTFLVVKGDSHYDWTEKFAACVIRGNSEDEVYKKALLNLPKAIGYHREDSSDPLILEGEEKDCVVDVQTLDDFVSSLESKWFDIQEWEEQPPF